jgi:hypothetical protein
VVHEVSVADVDQWCLDQAEEGLRRRAYFAATTFQPGMAVP